MIIEMVIAKKPEIVNWFLFYFYVLLNERKHMIFELEY